MPSPSRTIDTLGLSEAINDSSRYHPLRPQLKALDRQKQEREWRRLQSSPEYVVGSVHAVTEQGQVLIASAISLWCKPGDYLWCLPPKGKRSQGFSLAVMR